MKNIQLTFRRIIRYIWHKLYFLFKAPFLREISPRGLYYCHYCITKYINQEQIASQNQYDNILLEKKNKLEAIHFFEKMKLSDERIKYTLTTFIHIGAILCYVDKKSKEHVYTYIKNPDDLKFLKGVIKKKIII